jgi:hypothetical protein
MMLYLHFRLRGYEYINFKHYEKYKQFTIIFLCIGIAHYQ